MLAGRTRPVILRAGPAAGSSVKSHRNRVLLLLLLALSGTAAAAEGDDAQLIEELPPEKRQAVEERRLDEAALNEDPEGNIPVDLIHHTMTKSEVLTRIVNRLA